MEVRRCLFGNRYARWKACSRWTAQYNSAVKSSFYCLCNGLKCVAACRDCQGRECHNGVTSELFGDGNIDIEPRFDKNIFSKFWVYHSLQFQFQFS